LSSEIILDRSIPSLKREPNGVEAVAILLEGMQRFLNLDNNMNSEQLAETANLIIEEYPHFKIPDIAVFCNGVKVGRYVKLYNRISGAIIFEGLKAFDAERLQVIHEARRKEQEQRATEQDKLDIEAVLRSYKNAPKEAEQKRKEAEERAERWNKHRSENKDKILEHITKNPKPLGE